MKRGDSKNRLYVECTYMIKGIIFSGKDDFIWFDSGYRTGETGWQTL